QTTSMSFLPNMSARRETMGVPTAAVSSVMVTSQEALSLVVSRIAGKSGSSGSTSVCCSDTSVPHRARTVMTRPVEGGWRVCSTPGERMFTMLAAATGLHGRVDRPPAQDACSDEPGGDEDERQ